MPLFRQVLDSPRDVGVLVLGRVTNLSPLRVAVDGEDYDAIASLTVQGYIGSPWFTAGSQVIAAFTDPDVLVVLDAT